MMEACSSRGWRAATGVPNGAGGMGVVAGSRACCLLFSESTSRPCQVRRNSHSLMVTSDGFLYSYAVVTQLVALNSRYA